MDAPDGTTSSEKYVTLPAPVEPLRSSPGYMSMQNNGNTRIFEPSQEVIDSLVACFRTRIHSPSDQFIREGQFTDSILEFSLIRDEGMFVPVRRHKLDMGSKAFMRYKADLVCKKAQRYSFEYAAREASSIFDLKVLKRCWVATTVVGQEVLGAHLNTASDTGASTEKIIADLQKFVDRVKVDLKDRIVGILSNAKTMEEINRTCEVYHQILINVVFKDVISHLDRMRARAERPEEQKQFLQLLNSAVQMLGFGDARVELLSTKDAVVEGCQGLYTPSASVDEKSIVGVPMSVYGTYELAEFDDVLKTLAHELAHHVRSREAKKIDVQGYESWHKDEARRPHNLDHTTIAYELLRQLKTLRFMTHGGRVNVVEDDRLVKRLMARVEELFARRTKEEREAEEAAMQAEAARAAEKAEQKFPLVRASDRVIVGHYTLQELVEMAAREGKTLRPGMDRSTGKIGGYMLV